MSGLAGDVHFRAWFDRNSIGIPSTWGRMEFFNTHISSRAVRLATEVLGSGWVSEGKMVREFELQLSSRLGLANPVALNSGTSALHLALSLAGPRVPRRGGAGLR